jgi:MFS family permease
MSRTAATPNLWGVPLAVFVVSLAAPWAAYLAAISSSNWTINVETPVDPIFVLWLFMLVPATATAAVVGFVCAVRWGPKWGPLLGAVAGLALAAILGYRYEMLVSWWSQYVPTDTNRAAAFLAAWLVGFVSVALTLCVVALTGPVTLPRRRNRILGLGVLSAATGLLTGFFVGATVSAADASLQQCYIQFRYACSAPNPIDVIGSGGLIGSWVGAAVGLGIGWVVAALALFALPILPSEDESSSSST